MVRNVRLTKIKRISFSIFPQKNVYTDFYMVVIKKINLGQVKFLFYFLLI